MIYLMMGEVPASEVLIIINYQDNGRLPNNSNVNIGLRYEAFLTITY